MKKKTPRRARRAKTNPDPVGISPSPPQTAIIKQPPAVASDASGLYVKLPLSPELVALTQKYMDVGRELASLFFGAHASATSLLGALDSAADEIRRDMKKRRRRK